MNKASRRTLENLKGVDYKLVMIVSYTLAISEIDFFVNEGVRSAKKQQEYFNKGASKLDGIKKKSKHQLGQAVDIYYVGWQKGKDEKEKWAKLISSFKIAEKNLGIPLNYGYEWGWDSPHIELK